MRFKDASDRLQILLTLDVTLKSPAFHRSTGQRKKGGLGDDENHVWCMNHV